MNTTPVDEELLKFLRELRFCHIGQFHGMLH
jgi:hypothetical protein